MTSIQTKFASLATENAPGQEVRQGVVDFGSLLRGDKLTGRSVDFSHGDVDAFAPIPGALDAFVEGVGRGGSQAYTEYRGDGAIRKLLADRLGVFTGAPLTADEDVILTPGTQGALFLAMGATVARGTKVAIADPDYFANRKLVRFFEGELFPIALNHHATHTAAGIDLDQLEQAFRAGVEVFVFSNPNNPTGVIYSPEEIATICRLAGRFGATVIVDQLYSRLLYDERSYTHLRAHPDAPANLLTIIGPSKTESLSGYRLGVAFGAADIISRMEKLQAIVSLRAAGYSQAVLNVWFDEPAGWMDDRIRLHQAIRDDLLAVFRGVGGITVRPSEAGSYLFPALPPLSVTPETFVRILRHQAEVIVTPGAEFGLRSPEAIRLNFSQDHAAAVAAAERIGTLVERYRA